MRPLSERERGALLSFFSRLDDEDVEYVVLRKYERLPEAVPSDVDLFVDRDVFDRAVELSESVGFEPESAAAGSSSLLGRVARNPRRAVRKVVTSPVSAARAVAAPNASGAGDGRTCHRQYGDVRLDMVNRLRFPERGGEPVPPRVEVLLLRRRERCGEWYVPSPPDELAHVVVHCLTDYDGRFPEYYVDKCETLRETVFSRERYRAQLRELLDLFFGDDAPDVFEAVANGKYDGMSAQLSTTGDATDRTAGEGVVPFGRGTG